MPPKRASARVAAKATKVPDKAPDAAVASTVAKGKKRALSDNEDEPEYDDDEDEPVKKRRKKAPKRANRGKAKAAETNDNEAETVGADTDKKDDSVAVVAKDDKDDEDKPPAPPVKIVSVVKRGSAPVDPESNFVSEYTPPKVLGASLLHRLTPQILIKYTRPVEKSGTACSIRYVLCEAPLAIWDPLTLMGQTNVSFNNNKYSRNFMWNSLKLS
jgi:hypothetical protein